MASSSSEQSPFGALPSGLLVALLLGLGAIGWLQSPFKPERPPEDKTGLRSVGVEDVDARLWQDPFAAVTQARKALKEDKSAESSEPRCWTLELGEQGRTALLRRDCPGTDSDDKRETASDDHPLSHLEEQILARAEALDKEWTDKPDDRPLTVLGIMVSAGPAAGAAESRRRYRYAALSALMLEGFLPDDPERIGYADLGKDMAPTLVPYEWFTRDTDVLKDRHHQALVLLWLDDDSLGAAEQPTKAPGPIGAPGTPRPLARLSLFLTRLAETGAGLKRVGFQLIGPAGSGTLEAMTTEYRDYLGAMTRAPTAPDTGTRVARLWSPFATIPMAASPEPPANDTNADPTEDTAPTAPRRPLCPCGGSGGGCVGVLPPSPTDRTIASDDTLARMLVEELGQRRIAGGAGIALVGQWDTAYSRKLAQLVENEWRATQTRNEVPPEKVWVRRFSYMRGIDGQIPGSKGKKEEASTIERPGGDAQIDYLRRMRDSLLAEDAHLRESCGLLDRLRQHCGIRAIGVLGNDYYDKLLVLQALKPVFPDAVFFTTDLYADMLHPQDNPFTRNLIVASGFGLTLAQTWQREVPPLRDSYQSALLLTVRLAVRDSLGFKREVQTPPPARLFEIGRTQAVELVTPEDQFDQAGFRHGNLTSEQDPHPRTELNAHFLAPWETDVDPTEQADTPQPTVPHDAVVKTGSEQSPNVVEVALSLAGLLALLLGLANIGTERTLAALRTWWQGLRHGWLPSVLVASAVTTTIIILYLFRVDLKAGGEPLSLLEGVSVWPSEILRLAAGLIAMYFFIHGHRRQAESLGKIAATFPGLTGPAEDPDQPAPSAAATRCPKLLGQSGDTPRPAEDLWEVHANRCGLGKTLSRIWPEALGFLALAFLLMVAMGFPNHPTRSPLSWGLDMTTIYIVLIPFLCLLFFMVDATRQTLALARDLRCPVAWPVETMDSLGLGAWVEHRDGRAVGSDLGWLRVRLIAAVTRPVGNLVWYPVAVLIIIALARHPLFDAWSLPPALILVIALPILYAIGCALALRRAAEAVRQRAIEQLSAAILRAEGQPDGSICLDPLKTMLDAVVATRDGAFRPFTQQPVVQAMLTLVSSISGLALLQYSSMANL